MPRLSKIGAAALAAFGWTSGDSAVSASYLVVAGGGGGAGAVGGGGGAGGLQSGTASLNPTLSYTVIVGAGGAGIPANTDIAGNQGNNSSFSTITANAGGKGGGQNVATDTSGGSTGGAGGFGTRTGTASQGNLGGTTGWSGAGGGGNSAVGANTPNSNANGGAGGAGTASSITGSSVTYAGGGGGGSYRLTGGAGGAGGGGAGGTFSGTPGVAGTANTGGGGGGGSDNGSGSSSGAGGSGVVIISYPSPQKFGGGIVTTSGSNTIHTFQTSGTLSPLSTLSASYLIVAGGGAGGGDAGGGGGAGGLLSGSGVTIDTNSIYVVTVGAGGAGVNNANGISGTNSAFSAVSTAAVGGGYGGTFNTVGANGGSGGGGGGRDSFAGGTGTSGQGNNGGIASASSAGGTGRGGGGGGASAAGATGDASANGGAGTASSISGASVTYAGGGGGGNYSQASAGAGGAGGGGAGGAGSPTSTDGTAGTANLGAGGGGGGTNGSAPRRTGGNGGSGIVIISYAGATQLMAGGTVTISGGNVIHTFTSSGYLTPLKLVNNSLRFRSSASGYLNRTPTTAGNRQKFTYSAWIKKPVVQGTSGSTYAYPITAGLATGGNTYAGIQLYQDTIIAFDQVGGGANNIVLKTTAVYRDPAAWYHVVYAVDTTQATAANRAILYVNGSQITALATATYPSQNYQGAINNTVNHGISAQWAGSWSVGDDLYVTEVNLIDGQALTPNSFGTFNSYGVWQPITYGGSYGTNGFYLPFSNTTSTTTLCYDQGPNGNNWTPNNISLTTGSTYDSMTDVPTLTSATVANYCVLSPIDTYDNPPTQGNLARIGVGHTGSPWSTCRSTLGVSSGKWYFEATLTGSTGSTGNNMIGVMTTTTSTLSDAYGGSTTRSYQANGNLQGNNSTGTVSSATSGDVIMIAFDVDAGKLWVGKNGTWMNSGVPASGTGNVFTTLPTSPIVPQVSMYGNTGDNYGWYTNFGQQPWIYSPPSGFVALNTYNL